MADPRALAALAATRSSGPTLAPPPSQGGSGDVQALLARLQQARANKPRLDLSVAKTKPKSHAKPRGLLSQIRDAVVGLPKGIAHLGGLGLREASNVATGKTGIIGLGRTVAGDISGEEYLKANPLTEASAQSMVNTGLDIRHPTRFQQAVREGTIVDKLLEDVGNASLVAAGAGGVARAAGAGGLAAGLERVAALGGEAANAPISLPRAGLTALTERGLPRLGRLPLGAADELLGRRRTLGENLPAVFGEHGPQQMRLARAAERAGGRAESAQVRTGYKETTGQEKRLGNPSLDEEAAIYSIVKDQANMTRLAREAGATDAQVLAGTSPSKVPEAHLTPEAARIVDEYLQDPTLHPRVARGVEKAQHTFDQVQRDALAGTGRRDPLQIEQVVSNDPLPDRLAQFDREHPAGRTGPEWDAFLDDPQSYPARWRERMGEAARYRAMGLDVPLRPQDLAAAGVDPRYVPSGRPRLTKKKASKMEMAVANEGLTGDLVLSSEKRQRGGALAPMSHRTVYDVLGQEARQIKINEAYRTLVDPSTGYGAKTAADVLDPQVLSDIDARAQAEGAAIHPTDPGAAGVEASMIRGAAIRDAMREQRLEPWNPTGKIADPMPAQQITADTPFLATGMKGKIAARWAPKDPGIVLSAIEQVNKKFKGAVLPGSVRWQIGDLISNYLTSFVAGGVDPITLTNQMRKLRKLSPEQEALLDARVQDVGLTYSEQEWRHQLPSRDKARFREHPIKALQRPGYRLNSLINRTQRHGFYLEKLQRLLDKEGISLEQAGREAAAGLESPKVSAAIDKAVQEANDVLGAFDEMSPFERRVMRNLFPFYPWMRHITTLTARLAIDNPARAMWVMRVGSEGVDPDSEMPGYLRGAIHTPVGTFDTNFLNPFADPTSSSPLTPEGAMRSLSPALKIGAAALTGADLNRGGLQLSRPFDTSRRDEFGRQGFNPLALPGRLDELGYLISQQIPQTRMLVNLAPKVKVGDVNLGPVARYGQGTMLRRGKSDQPLHEDPRTEPLFSLLSVPYPKSDEEIADMLRSIRKRKKGG